MWSCKGSHAQLQWRGRKDASGLPKRSDILVADRISSARDACMVLPLPNAAPLVFGRRGANGLGVAPGPSGESLPWTLGVAREPRVSWPCLELTQAWFLGGSFRRLLKVWTTPVWTPAGSIQVTSRLVDVDTRVSSHSPSWL